MVHSLCGLVHLEGSRKVDLRARGRQFRYTDSRGREPTDLNESYLINLEQTFLAPSTNNGSTRLRSALPADFAVPNPATTTALTTPWTQVGLQVSSPTCLSRDHPKMKSHSNQAGLLQNDRPWRLRLPMDRALYPLPPPRRP